jgi:hypothetical protein
MYRLPVVVVDWDDAFIDTDDFSDKSAAETKPIRRFTVGWFICETPKGVVLATDHFEKKGYSSKMFIPWGMINEWYEICGKQ